MLLHNLGVPQKFLVEVIHKTESAIFKIVKIVAKAVGLSFSSLLIT